MKKLTVLFLHCWFLLFLSYSASALAEAELLDVNTDQQIREVEQMVELEQEQVLKLKEKKQWLTESTPEEPTDKQLQAAKLAVDIAEIRVQELRLDIEQTERTIKSLKDAAAEIPGGAKMAEALKNNQQEVDKKTEYATYLKNLLTVSEEVLSLQQQIMAQLNQRKQMFVQRATEQALQEKAQKLQENASDLEEKIHKLRAELLAIPSEQTHLRNNLQFQIFEYEEKLHIYTLEKQIISLQTKVENLLQTMTQVEPNLFTLRNTNENAQNLNTQINKQQETISQKINLIIKRKNILQESLEQGLINKTSYDRYDKVLEAILTDYQALLGKLNSLSENVQSFIKTLNTTYGTGLTARQPLPKNVEQWAELGRELLTIPVLAGIAVKDNVVHAFYAFHNASIFWRVSIIFIQLIWLTIGFYVWEVLSKYRKRQQNYKNSFSLNALNVAIELVASNWAGIVIFTSIIGFIISSTHSVEGLTVISIIGFVWFLYRCAIVVARMVLIQNTGEFSGKDIKLYNALKWSFILSALLTALTMLAHQLPILAEVTGFMDRLFMMVLLIVSYPLLKNWDVFPSMLAPYLGERNYLKRTIKLISILIPLAIFTNATIGLIGYVNLAWKIGVIEGQILIIFSAWLLLRGLINDLFNWVSEQFIRKVSNGWLWTQAFLKPLHQVIDIGLIFAALFALSWLGGRGEESFVLQSIKIFLQTPLFSLANTNITPIKLIKFFLVLLIVIWASRWSREFSYRWLYNKAKDSGVRNSLAAFTQYGTVTLGSFVIFGILGIDITTLAVLAGVLAVGLGFGLRDILSNLIGGLLLLIERPVRNGDFIQVGQYEGEVTHIGMRAITVRSWDNTDIIVPNMLTMTQPFINWTHKDSIIRTVFDIRIDFGENPHIAQSIIERNVARHIAVVKDPPYQVFLREVGDSALIFEVRYYIDLRFGIYRSQVRSEVLLMIWDALKQAGIRVPYPQQDVHHRGG